MSDTVRWGNSDDNGQNMASSVYDVRRVLKHDLKFDKYIRIYTFSAIR